MSGLFVKAVLSLIFSLHLQRAFGAVPSAPSTCGGHRVKGLSRVCDPDGLLTDDEAVGLQNAIQQFEDGVSFDGKMVLEMAVMLRRSLDAAESDAEDLCAPLAVDAHNTWGVGDAKLQTGIVLALAQHDRCVSCAPVVLGCSNRLLVPVPARRQRASKARPGVLPRAI
jgi:hypothetical protein